MPGQHRQHRRSQHIAFFRRVRARVTQRAIRHESVEQAGRFQKIDEERQLPKRRQRRLGYRFLAGDLGSPSLVLWIWVVGAACAFIGAMCYSELGVNLPSSGGEYVYLTEAFGPTWGFMTGWVSFFAGFSAPIAAAALAFSGYVGYFFPSALPDNAPAFAGHGDWTFRLGGAQWVACALVAVFTILNVLGVQRAARVQNVLTALKVAVIVSFIALGISGRPRRTRPTFRMPAVRDTAHSLSRNNSPSACFGSTWPIAAGTRPPTSPRSCVTRRARCPSLWRSARFWWPCCTWAEPGLHLRRAAAAILKGKLAVGALAASRLFGPEVAGVFSALMALSLMATVNAMVTIGPRVYYAMAKNGAFLASAAEVHPQVAHSRGGHRRARPLRHADDA